MIVVVYKVVKAFSSLVVSALLVLDCSSWSGVGWICLQILKITFFLQSFVKWPTLRLLRHIFLLRTNLFFLSSDIAWNPSRLYMKWFSFQKQHFICHEVFASELLSLEALWRFLIFRCLAFGVLVNVASALVFRRFWIFSELSSAWFNAWREEIGMHASTVSNLVNSLKLGYGISLSKALVTYLFQHSVAQSRSFFSNF